MAQKTSEKRNNVPDYKRIYSDLIQRKFPERITTYASILQKERLDFFDIQTLNNELFGKKEYQQKKEENKYKAYDKQTILHILRYQQQHGLNNTKLAREYEISRNTIARWRLLFGHLV